MNGPIRINKKPQVIILGAGASGLMCALEAGKRGRKTLVLDHANKPGKKILISGGGSCNFTNYDVGPEHFLSQNPHFCKSALSRYTQWDFLTFINKHKIAFHEREHGQLFCNESASQIVDALMDECKKAGVDFQFGCEIRSVKQSNSGFTIETNDEQYSSESLVVATGGLSFATIGASPLGYKLAEQFHVPIIAPKAGLVPFTLQPEDKLRFAELSGIAVDAKVSCSNQSFRENLLFTHRGLSGPSILQISSYWNAGEWVEIDLLPGQDLEAFLQEAKQQQNKKTVRNLIADLLPKRVVEQLLENCLAEAKLQELSNEQIKQIANQFHRWQIKPNGTEGYRTAEVTVGGIDCDSISSKTMEAKEIKGLYFTGEVLDVTGWLGGYNLQWAWSSGWCAGQFV